VTSNGTPQITNYNCRNCAGLETGFRHQQATIGTHGINDRL